MQDCCPFEVDNLQQTHLRLFWSGPWSGHAVGIYLVTAVVSCTWPPIKRLRWLGRLHLSLHRRPRNKARLGTWLWPCRIPCRPKRRSRSWLARCRRPCSAAERWRRYWIVGNSHVRRPRTCTTQVWALQRTPHCHRPASCKEGRQVRI